MWIEIDKKCIKNLNENFNVVGVYINDINSDILQFSSENTPILITGYRNLRTGQLDDTFREDGKITEQFIPIPNTFVNLPKRRNCDDTLNSHGGKLFTYVTHSTSKF